MIEALDTHVGELVFSGLAAGPPEGDLVILLHGFPQTSRAWRGQLARLAEQGFRAVAPDLRGFCAGARPDGPNAYSLESTSRDVLAIAADQRAGTFHLVGHDLGGILAWDIACRAPQNLRTLSAVSTPHLAPFAAALAASEHGLRLPPFELFRQPGAAEQLLLADDGALLRQAYQGVAQDAVEDYMQLFAAPGVLSSTLAYFRAFDFASWLALPASTVPTLFAWGQDDPFLDPSTARATRLHATGSYREAELEGVGHWVPELAAEPLAELLLEHLSPGG
jgi:pimeloyl-ACP methyl ester carboxylesterase